MEKYIMLLFNDIKKEHEDNIKAISHKQMSIVFDNIIKLSNLYKYEIKGIITYIINNLNYKCGIDIVNEKTLSIHAISYEKLLIIIENFLKDCLQSIDDIQLVFSLKKIKLSTEDLKLYLEYFFIKIIEELIKSHEISK